MTMLSEPDGVPVVKGPYQITPTTRFITTRARGRQGAFTFATQDVGADFRLGVMRASMAPDGYR
jgi:hypothetical protein